MTTTQPAPIPSARTSRRTGSTRAAALRLAAYALGGLVALAALGGQPASVATRISHPAAPGALQPPAAPAGDALVAIPLPRSRVIVQNAEAERPIDIVVEVRRLDGRTAARAPLPAVPPLASRTVDLDALDVPVGAYSAVVTGTGRVAALARHAWPARYPVGALDLAIAAGGAPARDLVVPYVALGGIAEAAALVVQNPSPIEAAFVDVALHAFEGTAEAPAWAGRRELPPGGSAILDLSGPGFEALGGAFRGFARLRASAPVAAGALLVASDDIGPTAAALEAQPAEAAAAAYAAWFWSGGANGGGPNALALVNPGAEPARVGLEYHGGPAAGCDDVPRSVERVVPPGGGVVAESTADDVPGLPGDCFGHVRLVAEAGRVVAASIVVDPASAPSQRRLTAAHLLPRAPAARWLLPHVRGSGVADPSPERAHWTTIALDHLLDRPVGATLTAIGADGGVVPAPGYAPVSVPPREGATLRVGPAGGGATERGFEGAAVVQADAALFAAAFMTTNYLADGAYYAPLDPDALTTTVAVPFLGRAPSWPEAQATPPSGAPSPTPVTVVPPAARPDPTQAPPSRRASIPMPARPTDEAWVACCIGLAWPSSGVLWGVDTGDGVGNGVRRLDPEGRDLGILPRTGSAERVAEAPDGGFYALDEDYGTLARFDAAGRWAGEVPLPRGREWWLRDVAAAPDGSLWLVDNERLEAHHVAASGEHLASWGFREALRYPPGDGGYRVAAAPDGSVAILTWARLLRFAPGGGLLAVWGAPRLVLGPDDFQAPMDVAHDAQGRVYVIEGTGRLQVFEPDGWRVASWMAFDVPRAPDDWQPAALAVGPAGEVAVADLAAGRVHVYAALPGTPPPPPGPHRAWLPRAER